MVVFVSCFAIMAQVFVVVAAGSVIAFIIQDLGDAPIAGWIIQGPLLMQSVLSPFIGRLSDVLDRKYMAAIPPVIAFVGAVVSAKANLMATFIGGGVLIGVTLSTISIVQAIPSEALPLKYRALANGFAFLGGAVGGLVGGLGAGGLTNRSPSGWVSSSQLSRTRLQQLITNSEAFLGYKRPSTLQHRPASLHSIGRRSVRTTPRCR